MFLKKNTNNMRSLLTVFAVFALAVTILWLGANNSTTNAGTTVGDDQDSPAATFTGTGVGPIPDTTTTGTFGTPLVVNFAVSGVSGNVTDVSVDMTMTHTWIGDLDVVLASPGGTRSLVIFSRVGTTTATGNGNLTNLGGTYSFSDSATANIWTASTSTNTDLVVPAGAYRTTGAGGAGQTNPAPFTSLNTTFGGLTPAQANGTWTLTFRDRGAADVGTVTAANLTVNPTGTSGGGATTRLNDFTGTVRTDFANLVFTTNGPITWKIAANPAAPGPNNAFIRIFNYGITGDGATFGDAIVTNDYTGDSKTEVAVYRDTNSTYYLAQFPNGTGGIVLDRAQPFGNGATDIVGAEGDYDGDGKADYTVIRQNASGNLIWYIMTTGTGTMRAVSFGDTVNLPSPFGATVFQGSDFTGDGRDELIYARRNGTGTAVTYFIGDAVTGAGVLTRTFGNFNTDVSISPDDYTGDGRADFVAVRQTDGNQATWYVNNPVTNVTTATSFGIADPTFATADTPVRGDYDGDGRHDIAVWRSSNQTYYWINSSNGSLQSQQWGAAGDVPLGSFGLY